MAKLLYVPLAPAAMERLRDLARTEKRDPRAQAAYMLEQALQDDGRPCGAPQGSPQPVAA